MIRRIAIAVIVLAVACGGDDDKKKEGTDESGKGDGKGGGSGLLAGAPTQPLPAGAGAAPARSLFGGKFAGVFGKATAGATAQSPGDLSQIFGKSLPTLTPALAGIGGGSQGAPAAPAPGATQALWAFAPADAAFGMVVSDGTLGEVAGALEEIRRVVEAAPGGLGKMAIAQMRQEAAADGVNIDDLRGWATQSGIDLTKGFAMFASTTGNVVVVLPVVDVAAFRKAVKDTDGDLDDKHCVMAQGRYVCAPQLAWAQAAAAPHDSPLAQRAAMLPAWLHGDVEMVTQLSAFPGAVQELKELENMMSSIGTLAVAANLDNGAISVRGWLQGKRGGPVGDAFAQIPAATLAGESAGATNFFHLRMPWQLIMSLAPMPPQMPLGPGIDARADLIDNLTGEVVTYSRGNEFLAEHLTLGLKDPARAGRAIEFLCDAGKQALPGMKKGAGSCSGTIELKELLEQSPDLRPLVQGMPPVPFVVQVAGKNLEVKVGWPGASTGTAADNAGNDVARELMTGNWNFVMWGMGFDPLAVAPGPLQKRLTAMMPGGQDGAGIAMARWLFGHVYDLGGAWALRDDGMYLLAQVTTYAGDPPDAYAGHQRALTSMAMGDYGSYRKQSADLAKAFPQTLTGRHGARIDKGVPLLATTGVWGIGAFAALAAGKKDVAVRDMDDISPAIPPAPVPAVGGMSESDVEKAYIRFADKVCACKDMNCFQKAAIDMSQKMGGQQPRSMSPKLVKAMEKMAKCMQKFQPKQ